MANPLVRAKALIEVSVQTENLVNAIRHAQENGVSESDLMATVGINQYSLTRLMDRN